MDLSGLPRFLVATGVGLIVVGLVLWAAMRLPVFQNLGRLPGDILIERGNTTVFVPIVSSILLSILLTIIVNLVIRR